LQERGDGGARLLTIVCHAIDEPASGQYEAER